MCQAYFRGYFDREGPVEKVEIVKHEENADQRKAYVTFVLPEDAAK